MTRVLRVGSWWVVEVGGHSVPVWGKNYVPDELMLLFTDTDRFVDPIKLDAFVEAESRQVDPLDSDTTPRAWRSELMTYKSNAGILRQRLELQGFSSEWVRRLSTAYFDDELEESGGSEVFSSGAAITAALTTRAGRAAAGRLDLDARERPEEYFLHARWEALREAFDDPRFALALSLCRTRASTEVELDLTDLVLGGWLTPDEHPHRQARFRMSAAVAADGPVVVITEGSSDAHRLRRSLEIAAPGVEHLFTFLDFDQRPPGGTDRVVSLVKGMAAAGVMNRIVAVLDNDTAGREAVTQLSKLRLPAQVVTVLLPEVPYARAYPTLGPSGPAIEDVNGRAASMEFMFGEDVLRDGSGELAPVRWRSFNETAGDYQGRLDGSDKSRVGARIDDALSGQASERMTEAVREGCARLADVLVAAAAPPQRIPASEGSILAVGWQRDPFSSIRVDI